MPNSVTLLVAAAQKLLRKIGSFLAVMNKTAGALPREDVDALTGALMMIPAMLKKIAVVHGIVSRETQLPDMPPIVDAAESLRMEVIAFGAVLDAIHGELTQDEVDDLRAALRPLPDLLNKVLAVYGVLPQYGAPAREAAHRELVFREAIAASGGMTFTFGEDD